jgi:hypothetical protein
MTTRKDFESVDPRRIWEGCFHAHKTAFRSLVHHSIDVFKSGARQGKSAVIIETSSQK